MLTAMMPMMAQTFLICKAHAFMRHGAVNGIVRSLHEDLSIEHHLRPCPGGGDVARNEVRRMNATAINGILFGGGGRTTSSGPDVSGWPWMDCLVRCLEMDYAKGDGCGGGGSNQGDAIGSKGSNGILVVLHCLLSVALFAESKNALTMGGGRRRGDSGVGWRQWLRILPPPILEPIGVPTYQLHQEGQALW
jgi:hypothetical protein